MTKSTITRERLQEIAEDGFLKHGESKEFARMALAAMGSEPHTDDELSNLLWYSQEATCHSDPNYYCEFQRLATPGLIAGIIRDLQERRKAERDCEMVILYRQVNPVNGMKTYWAELDPEEFRHLKQHTDENAEFITLYRHAQPAPVVPDGLNPETTDLVLRFASALADKLYKAEQKYGRSTDWMKDDWYDDCLQSLLEHIEKGDPKDVAAYCAFMWHHGWETKVAQPSQEEQKSVSDRQAIFALESAGAVTPIGRAYKMKLNACRAAMLAAAPKE